MELRTDLQLCVLWPFVASDSPELVRYGKNEAVLLYLLACFPHLSSDADAEFWMPHSEGNFCLRFAIQVGGEAFVGIGVIPQSGLSIQTAYFGYWLGEHVWGKGISTAAARAMAAYAFLAFPLARLEAPVFAWNPASMRVLAMSGFFREGVLRHSVFKDWELMACVLYAKLRVVLTHRSRADALRARLNSDVRCHAHDLCVPASRCVGLLGAIGGGVDFAD